MTNKAKIQGLELKSSIPIKYYDFSRSKIHDFIIAKCSRNSHLYRFESGDRAPTYDMLNSNTLCQKRRSNTMKIIGNNRNFLIR